MHQHNLAATVQSATEIAADNLLLQLFYLLSIIKALCFHPFQTPFLDCCSTDDLFSLCNTIFYLYARESITTTWNKA